MRIKDNIRILYNNNEAQIEQNHILSMFQIVAQNIEKHTFLIKKKHPPKSLIILLTSRRQSIRI